VRIVSLQHGSEPGGKLVGNIRCHYKWPPCLITDLSTAGHLHSFLLWTASKSSDPTSHFSSPQKEASHLRQELDSFCQGQLLILSLTSSNFNPAAEASGSFLLQPFHGSSKSSLIFFTLPLTSITFITYFWAIRLSHFALFNLSVRSEYFVFGLTSVLSVR